MTIAEIQAQFRGHGLEYSDAEVKERLAKAGVGEENVDADLIAVWAEAAREQGQNPSTTKVKRGKGRGLAKQETVPAAQPDLGGAIAKSETNGMATQPPIEQGKPVEEIRIDIPAQAIASVENMAVGMVLQIDSEVDAMATSVARLANNAGALFAYKLNQKIGMQSGVNEAESLARHGDAWSASRSRINDLISNIQQGAIAS